jgi:hypothetical protein
MDREHKTMRLVAGNHARDNAQLNQLLNDMQDFLMKLPSDDSDVNRLLVQLSEYKQTHLTAIASGLHSPLAGNTGYF